MRKLPGLMALLVLVPLALGACGDDGDDGGSAEGSGDGGAVTFAVKAVEPSAGKYAFEAPATVDAGAVKIDLTNSGKEPHQVALMQLDAGKTFADFTAAMADPAAAGPPGFAKGAGGVAVANPGGKSAITQVLEAGNYAVVCVIPGPDGKPHVANGMASALSVEGDGEGELPEADLTITTKDFEFDVPEIEAGETTIEIDNAGPSEHEAVLVALQPGKKGADVVAFFEAPPTGPPPFKSFVGGLAPIHAGGKGTLDATLEAGDYALLCFVPDPQGKPHFALGMMHDFKVA